MPEENRVTTPSSAGPTSVQQRVVALDRVLRISLIIAVLTVVSYVLLYLQTQAWQVLAVAAGVAAGAACLLPARRQLKRNDLNGAGNWSLAAIALAFGVGDLFWLNNTLFATVGALALFLLIGSLVRPRRWGIWLAVAVAYGGYIVIINQLQPLPRYDIARVQLLNLFVPIVIGLLVVILLWLIVREYASYSLRTKLVLAFLAVSLIPLGLVVIATDYFSRRSALEAADQLLLSGATKVADEIDDLITVNLKEIEAEAQLAALARYLALANGQRSGSPEETEIADVLQALAQRDTDNIVSYALLDANGHNVFDTAPSAAGSLDESSQDYFQQPIKNGQPFVSDVRFSDANSNQAGFYFSSPVRDSTGQSVGVLRALYKADILQEIVAESAGLTGPESFGVLFDENHIRLADAEDPALNFTSIVPLDSTRVAQLQAAGRLPNRPAKQLAMNLPDFENVLQNADTQPYFVGTPHADPVLDQGVIAKLKARNWYIVYLQTQSVFLASSNQQSLAALIFALLNVAGVVFAAVVITRVIVRPITQLTSIAKRVTEGDLTAQAPVETQDEVGALATTFNSMTAQLRGMMGTLEDRVQARTEQLRASADVGRTAASVLEPDELLRNVVNLITDRFGFYYTAVFIIDSSGRNAVLREATGEAGRVLKERGHQLEVNGQSMVGYAITRRRSRIALDVGEEAVRFANPLLPDTRSEIALPLIIGDQVLGALDVQSTQEAAFDEASAAVLQSMADQIAIAWNNALSYAEIEAVARRSRALFAASREVGHLQTDLAETIRATMSATAETLDYDHWCVLTFNEVRTALVAIAAHNWPEAAEPLNVQTHLDHPLVYCIERDTDLFITEVQDARLRELRIDGLRGLISVPIKSRDTIIGVLAFSRARGRDLAEGDLEVGRSLANLVAVAIENYNLVETSQRTLRELDEINRSLTGQSWERFVRRQDKREIIWVSHSDQLQPQQLPEVREALTQGRIATRTLEDTQQLGVAVPIKLRDVPVGALRLIIPQRTWNLEMATALNSIAGHVAQAAENARLIAETEDRLNRERALAEATEKVRQRNEIETILQTAATELARYLNAAHVAVQLSPDEQPLPSDGQR